MMTRPSPTPVAARSKRMSSSCRCLWRQAVLPCGYAFPHYVESRCNPLHTTLVFSIAGMRGNNGVACHLGVPEEIEDVASTYNLRTIDGLRGSVPGAACGGFCKRQPPPRPLDS